MKHIKHWLLTECFHNLIEDKSLLSKNLSTDITNKTYNSQLKSLIYTSHITNSLLLPICLMVAPTGLSLPKYFFAK